MAGVEVGVGYVDVRPDLSAFGRELRTKVSHDLSVAGRDAASSLRVSMLGAMKGIGAGLALGKIGGFLSDAVRAASDLNETMAFSRTVFDNSAAEMESWGREAVDNLGLSQRAALEAATTFGNMFVQLGFTTDQAAALSQNLVQLGVDFRSATNADITSVLQAQASAFRGEYDALQKFLPLLSAATVEQKAMELSGKRNAKELTAQEKAMATYELMLGGAGDAAGDFARTHDSLANQLQRTQAATENASAELGENMMPLMEEWNEILREKVIPALTELFGTGGNARTWASAINNAVGDMAGFLVGTLQQTLRFMANVFEKLPTDIGEGYAESLREAADAGDGLRDKLHASKEEIQAAAQATRDADAATQSLAGATRDATGATIDSLSPTREAAKASRDAAAADRDLESARREYDRLLREGAVDEEKVADARERLDAATRSLNGSNRDLARAQEDYNDAQAAYLALPTDTNADKLRDATDRLADAEDSVADAAARRKDAEDELAKARAGDPDYQDKLADAKDRVADAEDKIAKASTKIATSTPPATAALTALGDAAKTVNAEFAKIGPNMQFTSGLFGGLFSTPLGPVPTPAPAPVPASPINLFDVNQPVTGPPAPAPEPAKNVTINQTFTEPQMDPGLIGKAIAWVL